MIDRRHLIIGSAMAAAATVLPGITAGKQCDLYAAQWFPTRCFAVGDEVGYVAVDSFLGVMRFLTTTVTDLRAAGGGWVFELESVGKPSAVRGVDGDFEESWRRLWHLTKL